MIFGKAPRPEDEEEPQQAPAKKGAKKGDDEENPRSLIDVEVSDAERKEIRESLNARTVRDRIVAFFRKAGPKGATMLECQKALKLRQATIPGCVSANPKLFLKSDRLVDNGTGRRAHVYVLAGCEAGPACYRCGRVCQVWPVKNLDKGHAVSIRIAPDDRAFTKMLAPPEGVEPDKVARIGRVYCAGCLRDKKIRKLILKGKSVKRFKGELTA